MTADLAAKRKWSPDDAFFTPADRIVLEVLYRDLNSPSPQDATPDEAALRLLTSLNNPQHPNFQPTIFASWDLSLQSPRNIPEWFLQRYVSWARTVVRHQTDVVFVSHLIIYFLTIVPSAVYLFHHFTWLHAAVHLPYTLWCAGAFTLVMHNHIHNNGILAPGWKWFDYCFPYLLEPLMGHTWNSYYYHHIKAHHVESNGPSDPSSTLRYQRDSILHFLHYLFRFLVLGWWDLGSYFWGKGRRGLAVKAVGWNFLDFAAIVALARWKLAPTITVFILPMCFLRVGLMAGNWGQHAFVDDLEPDSDFRSSITVIDVAVSSSFPLFGRIVVDSGEVKSLLLQ